jgi:hypothetical protein
MGERRLPFGREKLPTVVATLAALGVTACGNTVQPVSPEISSSSSSQPSRPSHIPSTSKETAKKVNPPVDTKALLKAANKNFQLPDIENFRAYVKNDARNNKIGAYTDGICKNLLQLIDANPKAVDTSDGIRAGGPATTVYIEVIPSKKLQDIDIDSISLLNPKSDGSCSGIQLNNDGTQASFIKTTSNNGLDYFKSTLKQGDGPTDIVGLTPNKPDTAINRFVRDPDEAREIDKGTAAAIQEAIDNLAASLK